MKKEMFNQWYEEYGKEIAKNSLPIDNVDEKEIRITAKEIFNKAYDIFFDYMNKRLIPMYDHIIKHMGDLDELRERFSERKMCAESVKNEITPQLTKLYDSFYKDKFISKEQFDSLKSYFGKMFSESKRIIMDCNNMLSMLKQERRYVESLLPTR